MDKSKDKSMNKSIDKCMNISKDKTTIKNIGNPASSKQESY